MSWSWGRWGFWTCSLLWISTSRWCIRLSSLLLLNWSWLVGTLTLVLIIIGKNLFLRLLRVILLLLGRRWSILILIYIFQRRDTCLSLNRRGWFLLSAIVFLIIIAIRFVLALLPLYLLLLVQILCDLNPWSLSLSFIIFMITLVLWEFTLVLWTFEVRMM